MVSAVAAARVLTPVGFVGPARVVCDGGVIVAIEPVDRAPERIVAPGFVDLQVNGVDDVDCAVADGSDWNRLDALLLAQGTTSWCPTLVTSPLGWYPAAFDRVARAMARPYGAPRPEMLGVHLEGPFLGHAPGAHPAQLITAVDRGFIERLPAAVRLVTLAPEAEGAEWAVEALRSRGITVSVGHTRATLDEYQRVVAAGASMATHLYNAMSGVHHRHGGVALWSLTDRSLVAGLIADGVHVDSHAIALAFAAKGADGIALVTDSVAWRSQRFADRSITVSDGAPRLRDGTLAGSCLSMDRAVRTCVDAGVPLEDALAAASRTPARTLGADDRGLVAPGARADLVVLDDSLEVVETWVAGEVAARHGAA